MTSTFSYQAKLNQHITLVRKTVMSWICVPCSIMMTLVLTFAVSIHRVKANDSPSQHKERNHHEHKIVPFKSSHPPGSIIIDTKRRFLYLLRKNGTAIRYAVGVARSGFEWTGSYRITRKAKWPDWRPPKEMRKRKPSLPPFVRGGPNNPLGARALYLGSTLYRIHGTNEVHTIGQAVSAGCIRMTNKDVKDLYKHASVGAMVVAF